jgi:hypothetical protein
MSAWAASDRVPEHPAVRGQGAPVEVDLTGDRLDQPFGLFSI